jgi:ribosomal protein L21E
VMAKFKDGDRVQMTPDTAKANIGARSRTGVVVGQARSPVEVRIRRDGQKTVVLWHESAWELRDEAAIREGKPQ